MSGNKIIIFFICLAIQTGFAQNQANIWYFGQQAGLDFNSGDPVPLFDGQLNSHEGVATICDAAGSLLFYTDGITVWNKNHQVMQNGTGLSGDISSSQSAIIVPRPGSSNIYYIFTVDEEAGPGGFNFSEVDMLMNSGLGAVTLKNIQLLPQTTEKVTAVLHANEMDIWVITHEHGNNTFQSFLVTATGVNTTPVTSSAGQPVINDVIDALGYIKASSDGTKIVMCNYLTNAQLFDFNNLTGEVSNGIIISTRMQNYGAEFSPSGELLYTSIDAGGEIIQYNLQAEDIAASAVTVLPPGPDFGGALQLAPDGKIYMARLDQQFLSVIHNPDVLGAGCNVEIEGLQLGNRISKMGLPDFIQSYFRQGSINISNFCFGDATTFSLGNNPVPDSVTWDFGDGSSVHQGPESIITSGWYQYITTHTYAAPGTYTVTITKRIFGEDTVTQQIITIVPLPQANTPADMALCDSGNGQEIFHLPSQDAQILGDQSPEENTVTYHASAEDAEAGVATLPADFANTSNPQTIYARVTNNATGCHDITFFRLQVIPEPIITMEDNYNLCNGTSLTLTAPAGFDSYTWSTGQAMQSIMITQPGIYTLTVTQNNNGTVCSAVKTITVSASDSLVINDIKIEDWTTNRNRIIIVTDGGSDYEYSIDGITYQNSPVFDNLEPGFYTVYIRNDCGLITEEVALLMYPKFFTPNGDGTNDAWRIKYAQFEPEMTVHIFDRYGKLVHSFKGAAGWDGKYNGENLPSTDYWFTALRKDGREHRGHFSMLR